MIFKRRPTVGKGNSTNVDLCRETGTIRVLHRSQPKALPTVTAEEVQAALARARQSAVRAERNRLAGEIHDGLAQIFTVICMQLEVAKEELSSKEGDAFCGIQRAVELANFGLAEARRCSQKLRSSDELGLAVALQALVERSSVAGRLRCDFQSAPEIDDPSPLCRSGNFIVSIPKISG